MKKCQISPFSLVAGDNDLRVAGVAEAIGNYLVRDTLPCPFSRRISARIREGAAGLPKPWGGGKAVGMILPAWYERYIIFSGHEVGENEIQLRIAAITRDMILKLVHFIHNQPIISCSQLLLANPLRMWFEGI